MRLSPDEIIFFQYGFITINATILFTWGLMLFLAAGSKLITGKFFSGSERSRWQNLLEIVVTGIEKQIEDGGESTEALSRFYRHAVSVYCRRQPVHGHPGYEPPTGSLSTTTALALSVFVAVPFLGLRSKGWAAT